MFFQDLLQFIEPRTSLAHQGFVMIGTKTQSQQIASLLFAAFRSRIMSTYVQLDATTGRIKDSDAEFTQ